MGGMGMTDVTVGDETTQSKTATPAQKAAARARIEAQVGIADRNPPPAPPPDLADQLLQKAGASSLLRQQAKQGRKSSFLAGAMGDVAEPILGKKSILGGY